MRYLAVLLWIGGRITDWYTVPIARGVSLCFVELIRARRLIQPNIMLRNEDVENDLPELSAGHLARSSYQRVFNVEHIGSARQAGLA